jgi:hypothetical protein
MSKNEDARECAGTHPAGELQAMDPRCNSHSLKEQSEAQAAIRWPSRRPGKRHIKARLPTGKVIRLTGRCAETLLLLVRKSQGVSVFDFTGGPAMRLAAYIHILRGMAVPIVTQRVSHGGGQHAIYRLESPIDIIEVC